MESTYEHQPSTSASTVRGIRHLDMTLLSSPAPARNDHSDPNSSPHLHSRSPFRPSTPNSPPQSEPDSPSGDSVSSFPSVGSSFLFSSGPTSPPHPATHSDAEDGHELGDSTSGLVIPSLTLPSPSRRPTAYGQTLGDVRILLLGPKGSDMSAIVSQLVDYSEDVVEVGIWEEDRHENGDGCGKRKAILRVSTSWVEHRDRHGLERVEPARNVEVVELPPYDIQSEAQIVVERSLPVIHSPFKEVLDILNQEHPPSSALAHLLSSSCSPLYTMLILLANPSALHPVEKTLIESLSPHIPIVLLPPSHSTPSSYSPSHNASSSHLSAFRPASMDALRTGLFRTPSTLATLRCEAAARFLRWREVERAVERVRWSTSPTKAQDKSQHAGKHSADWWDKQEWEAQWGDSDSLSNEVALHLRRRKREHGRSGPPQRTTPVSSLSAVGYSSTSAANEKSTVAANPQCTAFDPLHLPSLVVFSFSLLGALRTRIAHSLGWHAREDLTGTDYSSGDGDAEKDAASSGRGVGYTLGIGLALVSAFCAGVGIGLFAATRI